MALMLTPPTWTFWPLLIAILTNYFSPPEKPDCHYDPVEGLVFTPETIPDPVKRAKVIEEQLGMGKLPL